VILVTHQLQFIKQADQIVVLKDGSCLGCGSYMDLLNKGLFCKSPISTFINCVNVGIDLFRYTAAAAQEAQPELSPQGSPSSRRSLSLHPPLGSFNDRKSRSSSYIESDIESLYDQLSIRDFTQATSNNRTQLAHSLEASNGDKSTTDLTPKKN